jgi:hypothetical protein
MEIDKTGKIAEVLKHLGHNSGWYIEGEKITWVDEPAIKPSQEQIDDLVKKIDDIIKEKAQQERDLKISAYTKLGLSEDEINAIIGSV